MPFKPQALALDREKGQKGKKKKNKERVLPGNIRASGAKGEGGGRSSITLQGPPHPACQLASRIMIEALHKPTAGPFLFILLLFFFFVGKSVTVPQEYIKVSVERFH